MALSRVVGEAELAVVGDTLVLRLQIDAHVGRRVFVGAGGSEHHLQEAGALSSVVWKKMSAPAPLWRSFQWSAPPIRSTTAYPGVGQTGIAGRRQTVSGHGLRDVLLCNGHPLLGQQSPPADPDHERPAGQDCLRSATSGAVVARSMDRHESLTTNSSSATRIRVNR